MKDLEATGGRVVAICGGVGGAKLALGLQDILADRLNVVVNVADDFTHLGLAISPDLDTVLYTLSGLNDEDRGWGRAGETWNFMSALTKIGAESWFLLGDRDVATHVERTRRLHSGQTITEITAAFAAQLGVKAKIYPVTNDPIRTVVDTNDGRMEFQRYFVEHRCEPEVKGIEFNGISAAKPSDEVLRALRSNDVDLVVICPSNPYLSIDPILKIPDLTAAIRASGAPVIAVSPIIGGQSIKGPTKKLMDELNVPVNTPSIAAHYYGLIDGLVVDVVDEHDAALLDINVCATQTLMKDRETKRALAEAVVDFGAKLRRSKNPARP